MIKMLRQTRILELKKFAASIALLGSKISEAMMVPFGCVTIVSIVVSVVGNCKMFVCQNKWSGVGDSNPSS